LPVDKLWERSFKYVSVSSSHVHEITGSEKPCDFLYDVEMSVCIKSYRNLPEIS